MAIDTTATVASAATSIAISLKRIADAIAGSPAQESLPRAIQFAITEAIFNARRN